MTPKKIEHLSQSAIVLISMYDDTKDKNSYRVYINHKEINATLMPNTESRFEVKEGNINIQIVKRRETASIDLVVLKDKTYKLRVFKDHRGHIELLQVANSSNE